MSEPFPQHPNDLNDLERRMVKVMEQPISIGVGSPGPGIATMTFYGPADGKETERAWDLFHFIVAAREDLPRLISSARWSPAVRANLRAHMDALKQAEARIERLLGLLREARSCVEPMAKLEAELCNDPELDEKVCRDMLKRIDEELR